MRTGYDVENLVEEICKIMYLSDFVVRSPKYKKKSGKEKEAADFLVPFDDALLVFQVKSKQEIKSAIEKDEKDYRRINAKIEEGIAQLTTIKTALKSGYLEELKNSIGITIPFKNTITKFYGIVIIDLIGEEEFPQEERTEILNGFGYQHDMPVHVFMISDFHALSSEIDTLPDFIDYLETRESLYAKGILSPYTSELDFLALYKTRKDMIEGCLTGECDHFFIGEGIWDSYQSEDRERIQKRNLANRPSYIIDDIIAQLRHSIGYTLDVMNKFPTRNPFGQGSVLQYWKSINELSKIRRLQRRVIGQKFLEKMSKADVKGRGYSLIKLEDDVACLVLSVNRSREERVTALYNLGSMAYCGLEPKKLVGIASEPLSAQERSYDVIFIEDMKFENKEELQQMFIELFGTSQNIQDDEYHEK